MARVSSKRRADQRNPSSRRTRLLVLVLVPVYLAFVTAAASAVHTVLKKNAPAGHPSGRCPVEPPHCRADPGSSSSTGPGRKSTAAACFVLGGRALGPRAQPGHGSQGARFPDRCVECMNWSMLWGNVEENVGSGNSVQAAYQELMRGLQTVV